MKDWKMYTSLPILSDTTCTHYYRATGVGTAGAVPLDHYHTGFGARLLNSSCFISNYTRNDHNRCKILILLQDRISVLMTRLVTQWEHIIHLGPFQFVNNFPTELFKYLP